MTFLSRRRFVSITAASAAASMLGALPAAATTASQATWRGAALGAPASMRLDGLSQTQAAPIIAAVEAELARLEDIFSLYRPGSEISRLNRAGRLERPSPELLEVLSLSATLHEATGGAFDPTVQPLWQALAQGGDAAEIERARGLTGFGALRFDGDAVRFEGNGARAITLNGIAQGAITDRIAALLRARGLSNVLIDMGEIAAIGARGDGAPWRVGLAAPGGEIVQRITLSDRAVATSASHAMILDKAAGQGHILAPSGGVVSPRLVSVSAPRAALADGLSTALCLLSEAQAARVTARFDDARLELFQG